MSMSIGGKVVLMQGRNLHRRFHRGFEGGGFMGWTYVFWAAFVEIFWVLGLKYSVDVWMWAGTVIALVFSFYFIIKACAVLPSGSVYATFTGAGAAAIALIDFTLLGQPFTLLKGLFIALIIVGVVGVQLTTKATVKGPDGTAAAQSGSL